MRSNKLFYLFIGIYLIWNLFTLTISPLPWFDETYFASITHSVMNGKGMLLEVCPMQIKGEVLTYGPVYFYTQALIGKIFGFGIFQFRLLNLLSGIIIIFIFYNFIKQQIDKKWALVLTITFSFDTIFLQNMHSGRMELFALMFFLIGLSQIYIKQNLLRIALFSFTSVISVLITFRFSVLVFPVLIFLFSYFILNKKNKESLVLFFIAFSVYMLWIFIWFGSINDFFKYYLSLSENLNSKNTIANDFLFGNFNIPVFQYLLIFIGLTSVFIVYKNKLGNFLLNTISIIMLLSFYLLVNDTGIYSSIIVVFWYYFIVLAFKFINFKTKFFLYLVGCLFFFNGVIYIFKNSVILLNLKERDPKSLQVWVDKNIPENSKIVGDDCYYYSSIKNKSNFQYILRIGNDNERAYFHFKNFKPEYLFLNNKTDKNVLKAYKKYYHFIDVKNYSIENEDSKINKLIPKSIFSSYEGYLIKLKPKNKRIV